MNNFSIFLLCLFVFIEPSIAFLNVPISSRTVARRAVHISASNLGSIALVGSGPGDPDLLTIQATKILNDAGTSDTLSISPPASTLCRIVPVLVFILFFHYSFSSPTDVHNL